MKIDNQNDKIYTHIEDYTKYTKKESIDILKNKFNIDFVETKINKIDEKCLSGCVSWLEAFYDKHEKFMNNIKIKLPKIEIASDTKIEHNIGRFISHSNRLSGILSKIDGIFLNGSYFKQLDIISQYVEMYIKIKHTVANAKPNKTFIHEFGHYIARSIFSVNYENSIASFINECIKEAKNIDPTFKANNYKELGDYLSNYGAKKPGECFAEAFAEFYGGENPRTFAKVFGQKLKKMIGG